MSRREEGGPIFELPKMLDRLLAALALRYEGTKENLLREIVVNGRPTMDEGASFDNWDGGTFGHDIRLMLPKNVFAKIGLELPEIRRRLSADLGELAHCPNEFIRELTVELDENTLGNWRQESGVFVGANPVAASLTASDLGRIWTPGFLRVFISHKAECKDEATNLKLGMSYYGLSGFVAHCDIKPTREWQDEIERALQSMHAMVLLLTKDYHDSVWTDQETGVAIGRGVPIVPVRIDIDPYGFVGKMQAVSGTGKGSKSLAKELLDLLLNNALVNDVLTAALITKFEQSWDFDQANELIKIIGEFRSLPQAMIDRLEKAPRGNHNVGQAFTVQRVLPALLRRLKGEPPKGNDGT